MIAPPTMLDAGRRSRRAGLRSGWAGTEQARAGVSGFAILPGIGEEEFGKLVELLNAKPDEVKQAGGAAGTIVWKDMRKYGTASVAR